MANCFSSRELAGLEKFGGILLDTKLDSKVLTIEALIGVVKTLSDRHYLMKMINLGSAPNSLSKMVRKNLIQVFA